MYLARATLIVTSATNASAMASPDTHVKGKIKK
jgi:hypothetical protein